MNNAQNLRDESRRRRLTEAEQAQLRAALPPDPAQAADLDLDLALTEALHRLPDAPVSSNFTARVLAATEREIRTHAPAQSRRTRFWRVLFPRVAFAASGVLTIVAVVSLISHHQQAEARQTAQSLTAVSGVASLPSPEVLQDFEAIRQLNPAPAPDERLLALFQ